MPAHDPDPSPRPPIDWESFYRDYRKPGYIPGYEIQTQLGSGAFGIVFKANKESIGKSYAIKFLKVDDIEIKDAVVRELDAVRYFAQVDHPNLVSIEDMGEVDGIPYIVMAFAGDSTLRKRIDAAEIEPGDREAVRGVFLQVARGVQALHEHSLVHFDIKPANVYLKGDVARIGDYGLSKLVTDSRNSLSMGRGTPYYMAPELLRRKGDARSDIYALGVLLYELTCGHPPFRGDSEWEVLKQHEEAEPEVPDSVLEPERSVILRAMAKRPEDRFDNVLEMRIALGDASVCETADSTAPFASAAIAGVAAPIHARSESAPPNATPPGKRRAREFDNALARSHGRRTSRAGSFSLVGCFAIGLAMFVGLVGCWTVMGVRHSPTMQIRQSFASAPSATIPAPSQNVEVVTVHDGSKERLLRLAETLPLEQARALRSVIQRSIGDDYDDDLRAAQAIVASAMPHIGAVLDSLNVESDYANYWKRLILQVLRDHGVKDLRREVRGGK